MLFGPEVTIPERKVRMAKTNILTFGVLEHVDIKGHNLCPLYARQVDPLWLPD